MYIQIANIKIKKNTAAKKLQNLDRTSEFEDMTIIDEYRDNQFKVIVGVNITGIYVKDKIKCNLKLYQKPYYDEIQVYGNIMKPLIILLIPFIVVGVLSFVMHFSMIFSISCLSIIFIIFFGTMYYETKKKVIEKVKDWLK